MLLYLRTPIEWLMRERPSSKESTQPKIAWRSAKPTYSQLNQHKNNP